MAKPIWNSTDGNWNDDAQWIGSKPADNDEVHFTGASVVDVTSGLTLATAGDVLDELNCHQDWTGSIGTSGGKLIADTVTVLRFASNGGKLFIDTDGSGVTKAVVTSTAGLSDMLEIDGTLGNLFIIGCSGGITLSASCVCTNITMMNSPRCTLTITAGTTGLTLIRQDSGLIKSNALITTGEGRVLMTGGRFEHTIGAIDLVEMQGGGYFLHTASATIVNIIGSGAGATFDGRQNRNVNPVTITDAEAYNSFNLLLKNSMKSYVVTNGVKGGGGNVVYETGEGVTTS